MVPELPLVPSPEWMQQVRQWTVKYGASTELLDMPEAVELGFFNVTEEQVMRFGARLRAAEEVMLRFGPIEDETP